MSGCLEKASEGDGDEVEQHKGEKQAERYPPPSLPANPPQHPQIPPRRNPASPPILHPLPHSPLVQDTATPQQPHAKDGDAHNNRRNRTVVLTQHTSAAGTASKQKQRAHENGKEDGTCYEDCGGHAAKWRKNRDELEKMEGQRATNYDIKLSRPHISQQCSTPRSADNALSGFQGNEAGF